MADAKIWVDRSAVWGMVAAFARDAIKLAGASLVTRGLATSDMIDQAAGIAVAMAPIVYSQLKTLWNHRTIVRLAEKVPNRIAEVKP